MSTTSVFSAEPQGAAPAALSPTRPMYWSVRRELWENRFVYIVPMIVAALALFGTSIHSLVRLSDKVRNLSALDPARQRGVMVLPFSMAASAILFSGFLVAFFYCLDALNSERRDRSILFWKSMPVSDSQTVLSKVAIPMVVLPALTFTIALVTQWIMLMVSTVFIAGHGLDPTVLWSRLSLFQMTLIMFYGLTAHALWFAPIYCWLLLVSGWARRAVILWAVLPFFGAFVIEKMAIGTNGVASLLKYRFGGAMDEAFAVHAAKTPILTFEQLSPLQFITSPGLWFGLIFAGAFLIAAIRLRRRREPN